MKKLNLLFALMCFYLPGMEQNISVTFTGTGATTLIDSVTATNLTTNQKVTLPGNETLVLISNTGIPTIPELAGTGIVYPNPFSGQATFNAVVHNPQTVYLKLQNLVGQVVAQTKALIQPGENEFALFLNRAGIYMVTLTTDQGNSSHKVICTETNQPENRIQYLGSRPNNHNNLSQSGLKSSQSVYSLGFQAGEIILYRCSSDIYTTIVTDSPVESKNYEVEFAACTDFDGKNYSIVNIGSQTWMAENLAYLPEVRPFSISSLTKKLYYVHLKPWCHIGYNGTSVSEAKESGCYNAYGVLYNWPAAKAACPSGWRLPFDEDWKTLEKQLLMSSSDADSTGQRLSGGVGAKLYSTNESGFSVLPGGYRDYYTPGMGIGDYFGTACFWSASEFNGSGIWIRWLNNLSSGVGRYVSSRDGGYSARCLQGARFAEVTTANITEIAQTAAVTGGNITADGGADITARGVCWSTSPTPTTKDSKTINGSGTGIFISSLTGLAAGTRFYATAYATNEIGTAYGEQKQFTTYRADGFASVTTADIINITDSSAFSGADIPNDGGSFITSRGVCWSTMPNPTSADNITIDGSGIGSFTSNLTGLHGNTIYYLRAYATNGKGTSYGEQKQFITNGTVVINGHTYAYRTIGTQTWMINNMDYLPNVSPSSEGSDTSPFYYVYGYEGNNVSEAKATENYSKYGVLYNWEAALTVCPSGWHLPSNGEWDVLASYLGSDAGQKMKATTEWTDNGIGDNSSGFNALPAGYRSNLGGIGGLDCFAYYWTSVETYPYNAFDWYLSYEIGLYGYQYGYKKSGYSVRCLKDPNQSLTASFTIRHHIGTTSTNFQFDASGSTDNETDAADLLVRWDWDGDGTWDTDFRKAKTSTCQYPYPGNYSVILEVKNTCGLLDTETKTVTVGDGIFTDIRDGHEYVTKAIGTQTWMAENLAYLPSVSPSSEGSVVSPYYYVNGYEGSGLSEAKLTANYAVYGVLYNWEAALTACPMGWNLPTDEEWKTAEKQLGMSQSDADTTDYRSSGFVGQKLKSKGGWFDNRNGDNISGFTALPGGLRHYDGGFHHLSRRTMFWSSSAQGVLDAWLRCLLYNLPGVYRNSDERNNGFSVRCVKN